MIVTIQVSPELAHALQGRDSVRPNPLHRLADEFGISLRPQHPGVSDPALQSYFTAEVDDASAAERLVSRLLNTHGVEAAYVKPPEALP